MDLRQDNLEGLEIRALLQDHLDDMALHSPPESIHALDLDALRQADITFWSVWEDDELLGCGALKQLNNTSGEIKSMRTSRQHLRKGVAAMLLKHIISTATLRGYLQLSLETGSALQFKPARKLYMRHGFRECEPFAEYSVDPHSVFMTRRL